MISEYRAGQLLPLSGIQHFIFCRRQWALIHVERQWKENALTAAGRIMHRRADDPFLTEKRGDVLIARSVPVVSYQLGLTGICDVVEFQENPHGVNLPNREGRYLPFPVEYKHGKKKQDQSDEAQLCTQAICLEDMLLVTIPRAYLFYGKARRRVPVELTEELRSFVRKMSDEMHAYFERGYTPRVKPSKACRSCSLADLCLPQVQDKPLSASQYIQDQIENL